MDKEIRNILAARINLLQKDYDTLRLLSELAFEIDSVLTGETE